MAIAGNQISTLYSSSSLGAWLTSRYAQMETNQTKIRQKWDDNLAAFRSELAVAWKAGEGTAWRSTQSSNMVRNKIVGALAIMMDTALSGGRVPFMLEPCDFLSPELRESSQWQVEEMEKYMRWQQEVTDEDRELRRCALSGLIYGMGWNKKVVRKVRVHQPVQAMGGYNGGQHGPDGQQGQSMSFGIAKANSVGVQPGMETGGGWTYETIEEHVPASRTLSLQNMFWDLEERDVDDMEMIAERDYLSYYQLRKLMGPELPVTPDLDGGIAINPGGDLDAMALEPGAPVFISEDGYIPSAIKRVLERYPQGIVNPMSPVEQFGPLGENQSLSADEPKRQDVTVKGHLIRRLALWGLAPREVVEAFEQQLALGESAGMAPVILQRPGDDVEVMAEICGWQGEVIRFLRVERHERPYHFWQCEESLDELGPRGIADNTQSAWKEETGYLRAALDCGNLAANQIFTELPHLLADDGAAKELYPGVIKRGNEQCDDISKAFGVITIPDVTGPLLEGIKGARERGDEDSGVPRLIQGFSALGAKATATEIQELSQRGMQTFGQFMRNFDDGRIEPMEQWRLEYNMDDERLKDKWGPFKVQALGFSSFQGRVVKFGKMNALLQLIVSDPSQMLAGMINLHAFMEEILKEIDVDPAQFMKSPEEIAMEQQQQAMMQMQQMDQQAQIEDQQARAGQPGADEQRQAEEMHQAKVAEIGSKVDMNRASAFERVTMAGAAKNGKAKHD